MIIRSLLVTPLTAIAARLAGQSPRVPIALRPQILAGAIAGQARSGSLVVVRAIGAKAVFEMLRAVGVARAYLDDDGLGQDLVCFPDFVEVVTLIDILLK